MSGISAEGVRSTSEGLPMDADPFDSRGEGARLTVEMETMLKEAGWIIERNPDGTVSYAPDDKTVHQPDDAWSSLVSGDFIGSPSTSSSGYGSEQLIESGVEQGPSSAETVYPVETAQILGDLAVQAAPEIVPNTRIVEEASSRERRKGLEGPNGRGGSVVLVDWQMAREKDRTGNEEELESMTLGNMDHVILETDDGEMYEIRSFSVPEGSISVDDRRFSLTSTVSNKNRDSSRPRNEVYLTSEELEKVVLTVGEQLLLDPDNQGKRKKSRGKITRMTSWGTRQRPSPPGSERREDAEESDVQERFARAVHDPEIVARQLRENMEEHKEKAKSLFTKLNPETPVQAGVHPDVVLSGEDFADIEDIVFTAQRILDLAPRIQDGTVDDLLLAMPNGSSGETLQIDNDIDGFEQVRTDNGEMIIKLDQSTMNALVVLERSKSIGRNVGALKRRRYPRESRVSGAGAIETQARGVRMLREALRDDIRQVYNFSRRIQLGDIAHGAE